MIMYQTGNLIVYGTTGVCRILGVSRSEAPVKTRDDYITCSNPFSRTASSIRRRKAARSPSARLCPPQRQRH